MALDAEKELERIIDSGYDNELLTIVINHLKGTFINPTIGLCYRCGESALKIIVEQMGSNEPTLFKIKFNMQCENISQNIKCQLHEDTKSEMLILYGYYINPLKGNGYQTIKTDAQSMAKIMADWSANKLEPNIPPLKPTYN